MSRCSDRGHQWLENEPERHRRAGALRQVVPEALKAFECDAVPDYTGNYQRYANQNDQLRQDAEFVTLGISLHGAIRLERLGSETLVVTLKSGLITRHGVFNLTTTGRCLSLPRSAALQLDGSQLQRRQAKDSVDRNRALHGHRLQCDRAARASDQDVGPCTKPEADIRRSSNILPRKCAWVQSYGRRKHGPGERTGARNTDVEPDRVDRPFVTLHRIGSDLLEFTFHGLVTKNDKADARIEPAAEYACLRPGLLRFALNRRVSLKSQAP